MLQLLFNLNLKLIELVKRIQLPALFEVEISLGIVNINV